MAIVLKRFTKRKINFCLIICFPHIHVRHFQAKGDFFVCQLQLLSKHKLLGHGYCTKY